MTRLCALLAAGLCMSIMTAAVRAQEEPAPDMDAIGATGVVVIANPAPPTKLEALLFRKGAIIIKGYTEVGTVLGEDGAGARVLAVELTDQSRKEKVYGLAIEIHQSQGRTTLSYVDYDEIDALSDAISAMAKLDRTATTLAGFDAQYRSKGNVEVMNVDDNGARLAAIRSVQILPITGQVLWATARFRLPPLLEIQRHVLAAKEAVDKARTGAN